MEYISKEKLKELIDAAPPGVGAKDVIAALLKKGSVIEGLVEFRQPVPGQKGDKGDTVIGPPGPMGPPGKDSIVPGPKGDKGDTVIGPPGKDGSPDTAVQVRDKLTSLEGDERLDAQSIKNLPQFTERIIERVGGGFVETPLKDASTGRLLSKDAFGAWLISASGGSSSGLVFVTHKDGTSTAYNAASDSDTARGTALLAAATAAVAGDTLYLTAHTFDIGTSKVTLPASTNIIGSGKYSTIVKGKKSSDHIIQCGNNTVTSDLSLVATNTSGFCLPWGNDFANVDKAVLASVYISGNTDCIYLGSNFTSNVEIHNVDAFSNWDVLYSENLGTINVYDSNFTATASGSVNGGASCEPVFNNGGGTINLFNVISTSTGASTNNYAFMNSNGTALNIFSGKAVTSGSNSKDLYNDTGSLSVSASVVYDVTKVAGNVAIAYLDSNQIVKSLGAADVDFGTRTLSPRGTFDIFPKYGLPAPASGSLVFAYGNPPANTDYNAEGNTFGVRVYAFRTVSGINYYSSPLEITGTDNGSFSPMTLTFTWTPVSGASGYRIAFLDPYFLPSNYDSYWDNVGVNNVGIIFGDASGTENTFSQPVVVTPSGIGGNLYFNDDGTAVADSFALEATGQTGTTPLGTSGPVLNIKSVGRSMELETTVDSYGSGANQGVKMTLVNEDFHNGALFKNKSLDLVDFQFAGASTNFSTNNKFATIRWEARGGFTLGSGNGTRGEFQIGSTVDTTGIPAFIVGEGTMGLTRGRFSVRSPSNTPTAYLHIGAGTTAASTAPLKLTSGTSMTSAEAGAVEYTTDDLFFTISTGTARKRLLMADATAGLTSGKLPVATTNGRLADSSSTGYVKVASGAVSYQAVPIPVTDGGTGQTTSRRQFTHFADAGNGTTVETDLYSDTIAAGRLTNNGDLLEAEYGGTFVSSGTATRDVRIYFGGTAIFDTGALTLSLSAAWTAYVSIIRVSSTTVRYSVSFTTEGAALAAYTAVGQLAGLTLANTQVMKITGQAAGVGAATNDIVAKLGFINYESI